MLCTRTYVHTVCTCLAVILTLLFQIVPMLAHHNDATAAEVLAFLSVFLYDGNEMVQVRWITLIHVYFFRGEPVDNFSLCVSDAPAHTLIHTYLHSYIHTCTHTYTHALIRTHMHSCMHTCTHACTHTCTHALMHACTHTCTHALMYALHMLPNLPQAGFAYLTQTREERFFVNIRKRLDHALAIDTERCDI